MPNYVDNLDLIDPKGSVVNALIQDRETLALATTNKNDIIILDDKIDQAISDLSKITVYTPAISLGVDNTGVTDCSSILSNVGNNIGFKAGTYLIDNNCTINAQVVMPCGAKFNVTSGHTLTINGQILAGRYTIFEGSGNIVVDESKQDFGYPEWFNKDLHKTYAVFKHIILGYGDYTITSNLVLNKSNTCIEGIRSNDWQTSPSRIIVSNCQLILGNNTSTEISEFASSPTLKNFEILGNTTGDCLSVYGVNRAEITNISIYTTTAYVGIALYRAIATLIRDVVIQDYVNGSFFGIKFVNSDNTGIVGHRSSSVWVQRCIINNTYAGNNSYGIWVESRHSDIFIDGVETDVCTSGLVIENPADDANDIIVSNCILDACTSHCILVSGAQGGNMQFSNNYVALSYLSTGAAFKVDNNTGSTLNFAISNMQILQTANGQRGIELIGQARALINGVVIDTGGFTTEKFATTGTTANILAQYMVDGVPTSIT